MAIASFEVRIGTLQVNDFPPTHSYEYFKVKALKIRVSVNPSIREVHLI